MKKQIYLHVPKPCHENYESMNSAQQGRFCQSCSKTVVDFSGMTDKEILDALSKTAGKTCGWFTSDQLARPITKEIPFSLRPNSFLMSAFMPAFLLANSNNLNAQAQKVARCAETIINKKLKLPIADTTENGKIRGEVKDETGQPVSGASIIIKGIAKGVSSDMNGKFLIDYPKEFNKVTFVASAINFSTVETEVKKDKTGFLLKIVLARNSMMMGEVIVAHHYEYDEWGNDELVTPYTPKPKREIKGQVVNATGQPVAYATVKLNTRKSVVADSNGMFCIKVREDKKKLHLSISSAGYEAVDASVDLAVVNDIIKIPLTQSIKLEDSALPSVLNKKLSAVTGGLFIVRPVTIEDTARTFIQKVLRNGMFKIFPNPASKGADVNVTFNKTGEYSMLLFDNSGKLYLEKQISCQITNQPFAFTLPATLSQGMYYIKAIDTLGKKQFTDKIIVR